MIEPHGPSETIDKLLIIQRYGRAHVALRSEITFHCLHWRLFVWLLNSMYLVYVTEASDPLTNQLQRWT